MLVHLFITAFIVQCSCKSSRQPWGGAVVMMQKVLDNQETKTGNLINETDNVMMSLQKRYERIALFFTDNNDKSKYMNSVLESFFQMLAKGHLMGKSWPGSYPSVFNTTLDSLKKMSNNDAIQFASPVRQYLDILKSILATPITIIQKHCQMKDSSICQQKYFAAVFLESVSCPNIFNHDTVFQNYREYTKKEPAFDKVVLDINRNIHQKTNETKYWQEKGNSTLLFDVVVAEIEKSKESLKDGLVGWADLFQNFVDLQINKKLGCVDVNRIVW